MFLKLGRDAHICGAWHCSAADADFRGAEGARRGRSFQEQDIRRMARAVTSDATALTFPNIL